MEQRGSGWNDSEADKHLENWVFQQQGETAHWKGLCLICHLLTWHQLASKEIYSPSFFMRYLKGGQVKISRNCLKCQNSWISEDWAQTLGHTAQHRYRWKNVCYVLPLEGEKKKKLLVITVYHSNKTVSQLPLTPPLIQDVWNSPTPAKADSKEDVVLLV